MKKGIVYKGDGTFDYCGWPTVARIDDNTLAVAYSGNRLRHVCTFGRTMVCYSYDEGKTWSKPMAVIDTKFDDRDGGIVANGKQVIVSSFNNNYAFQLQDLEWQFKCHGRNEKTENEAKMIRLYIEMNKGADESDVGSSIAISEDGGKTYPTRVIVPITSPHGPKVLSDGSYVWVGRSFAIAERDRDPNREYNFLDEGIYVIFSKDGYTWSEPKRLPSIDEPDVTLLCEPDIIQLKNGELLVQIRVHKSTPGAYHLYQTVSSNGMTEWSKPEDLHVLASPPHLMRHSSGKLICSVARRDKPIAEQILLSDDEGKTWDGPYDINTDAPNGDMGYPSTVELKDGSLMTVYYQNDPIKQKNYVEYVIWTLDELKK